MRSRMNANVSAVEVHDFAAGVLQQYLQWCDHGPQCTVKALQSVLFTAAARTSSIFDACQRLKDAPSDEAVRQALRALLPRMEELLRRLNQALRHKLPKSLRCRPRRLGVDITELPYHGKPHTDANEIRRGKPKHGTTHFHCYASLYVIRRGERFTVAMDYVRRGDSMKEVLQRLLRQLRKTGIQIRVLLLDRGFYNIDAINYLKRARVPFLLPVVHRGRTPRRIDARRVQGTRRFLHWRRSGWSEHVLRRGRHNTRVKICVSYRKNAASNRRLLVYAYWGFAPPSPAWVRETYRQRFAIETSYRQMNQGRIRTCSRDPLLRLLLVGIALILRNVWVWWHRMFLSRPRGEGFEIHLETLRFRTLLLCLQRCAEKLLGNTETAESLVTPPP
jgi:Transposase DDE domain